MAIIEAIATTYLEADAASVTFSGIPSTYEHLQLRINARSVDATQTTGAFIYLRFNGVSSAVYSRHFMTGYGTTTAGGGTAADSYIKPGVVNTALDDAAAYSGLVVDILDYAEDGNKNTTVMSHFGSGLGYNIVGLFSSMWDSTDDVTQIALTTYDDFARGSEFTLYGLNSS